jgi:hypothetical protein
MSPTTPTICTHDRGRGTTVCLRCRHDEWQASQKRRQQMLMRFFGLVSVVGIIAIAAAAGAITLRGGGSAGATETSAGNVSLRQEGTKAAANRPSRGPRPLTPTPARTVAASQPETTTTVSKADAAAVSAPAKGGSLLGQGRTTLTDSIYAVRTGDSVLVNFDTQGNRTRRADKFEQMLRTTLPLVYGRRITSALDSVPTGLLLPSRDVVGDLTSQGVHLMLDNGLRISLWPQTRPSADGPLVVAYRVVVER